MWTFLASNFIHTHSYILLITLCVYAQQGYVFDCIVLCVYI